jgi:hypothetical protein
MSDVCVGDGLQLSAVNGTITSVFWDGWVSGGPSRTINEKTVTVTKGAAGTSDTLPDSTVTLVKSVVQSSTTYVEVTDYTVTTDSINWSPAGAEPAEGSTYTVTYTFTGQFEVINNGYGVNINSTGATIPTSWPIRNVSITGTVEGHSLDAIRIRALRTNNIRLSGLELNTNVARNTGRGGILISQGRNILIDNYVIDGWENAQYGIAVRTDPVGAPGIGVTDDINIGKGRIKNCRWYGDSFSGIPGIGLQVVGTATNVVIDGCNARDNPINDVARGSAFHSFPTVVRDSPGVNPTRYTATWNPGTISGNGVAERIVSAPGVALGDFIENASFGLFLPSNVSLQVQVSIDNIVARLHNKGGGSVTIGSGTLRVDVLRNY